MKIISTVRKLLFYKTTDLYTLDTRFEKKFQAYMKVKKKKKKKKFSEYGSI